jgi:hypothetical protein
MRPWPNARAALVAAALAGAPGIACSQEGDPRYAGLADALSSADSDGMHATRIRAGGLVPYANPWRFSGAAVQATRYSQGDFRGEANAVLGIYRDQRRDTLAGIDIEAGVARVSGHLRPIGEATWRLTVAPGTSLDLLMSADLVETRPALERAIGYTFAAVAAERAFGDRFTATALAGYQSFSDGNARTHLRAHLIWLAVPEQGITLQLRGRQYASRESDVGGAYFNPDDYRQWLAVAAIRKRHAGWMLSGAVGAGQERSSGQSSRPTYLAEARAEGPIAGHSRLTLRAGYNRSTGFIDDPDYASWYVGAAVTVPFN